MMPGILKKNPKKSKLATNKINGKSRNIDMSRWKTNLETLGRLNMEGVGGEKNVGPGGSKPTSSKQNGDIGKARTVERMVASITKEAMRDRVEGNKVEAVKAMVLKGKPYKKLKKNANFKENYTRGLLSTLGEENVDEIAGKMISKAMNVKTVDSVLLSRGRMNDQHRERIGEADESEVYSRDQGKARLVGAKANPGGLNPGLKSNNSIYPHSVPYDMMNSGTMHSGSRHSNVNYTESLVNFSMMSSDPLFPGSIGHIAINAGKGGSDWMIKDDYLSNSTLKKGEEENASDTEDDEYKHEQAREVEKSRHVYSTLLDSLVRTENYLDSTREDSALLDQETDMNPTEMNINIWTSATAYNKQTNLDTRSSNGEFIIPSAIKLKNVIGFAETQNEATNANIKKEVPEGKLIDLGEENQECTEKKSEGSDDILLPPVLNDIDQIAVQWQKETNELLCQLGILPKKYQKSEVNTIDSQVSEKSIRETGGTSNDDVRGQGIRRSKAQLLMKTKGKGISKAKPMVLAVKKKVTFHAKKMSSQGNSSSDSLSLKRTSKKMSVSNQGSKFLEAKSSRSKGSKTGRGKKNSRTSQIGQPSKVQGSNSNVVDSNKQPKKSGSDSSLPYILPNQFSLTKLLQHRSREEDKSADEAVLDNILEALSKKYSLAENAKKNRNGRLKSNITPEVGDSPKSTPSSSTLIPSSKGLKKNKRHKSRRSRAESSASSNQIKASTSPLANMPLGCAFQCPFGSKGEKALKASQKKQKKASGIRRRSEVGKR